MSIEQYENTVEGRVHAYLDFTFITAENYLRPYAAAYGFHLRSEAQDVAQEVARKTIETQPYGPSLGAGYFKQAAENGCKDLLAALTRAHKKTIKHLHANPPTGKPDASVGFIDLMDVIKGLDEAQKKAVMERYLGYPAGTLTGSAGATKQAIRRAREAIKQRHPDLLAA